MEIRDRAADRHGRIWEARVLTLEEAEEERVPAFYLDLDDLIREKESAGRPQDLVDLAGLRRAKQRKSL